MSVSKMSANIRQHIVSRLKEVIEQRSPGDLTARKLANFEEYTSRKQIRADTDTVGGRHESIMSRAAFDNLLNDFKEAKFATILDNQVSKIVSTITFDGFVQFISEKYYKDKEFLLSDNRRVKGGFVYSGPTRQTTQSVAVFARAENRDQAFRDVLLLKNIPQGNLVEFYVEYIAANSPGLNKAQLDELKASLQGGHLTGVFTARLIRAFNLQKDQSGSVKLRGATDTQLTQFETQLASIVNLVTDADFLSSNIYTDIELFTQTDKRLYSNAAEIRLTTEIQFAKSNEAAGKLLTQAGTYLSKLIQSIDPTISVSGQEAKAQKAFEGLLNSLRKVSEYVKDRAAQIRALESTTKLSPEVEKKLAAVLQNQQTIETLLTTEGSSSILKHIGDIVSLGLQGKQAKPSQSKAPVRVVAKRPGKEAKKSKLKAKTGKPKSSGFKQPKLKIKKELLEAEQINLVALQNLINTLLHQQIRQNMGDGNRRDVLNYETGRFAQSAQVERLTQGRSGMITAYYTYMKYPYATFSEGGLQEFPRSRDPKLLISKSIRDIAQQQMITRMRAQLV